MSGTPATAGVLVWAALAVGCASAPVSELVSRPPTGLAPRAEIERVPFFAQDDYQCGPASLAMVLRHAGRDATPETLVPQVYLPARQGALQAEMLATTRRYGLVAYAPAPRLGALLSEVAAGHPAVVLQNLALDWAPRWHYAVVIGYDLGGRTIVLHSGTTRRLEMSLDTFERTWARGGHWAMLALEPGRLPAQADEGRYLAALAALERVAPAAARRGYEAALSRWPGSAGAGLGLGNATYALGDLAGAAMAYERVVASHPDSGDAWNNLAHVLAELGRRDDALVAARRAVALGGPRAPLYLETLNAVERRR